jgi:hypothetical protein
LRAELERKPRENQRPAQEHQNGREKPRQHGQPTIADKHTGPRTATHEILARHC